jgi:hypothetical protein
MKKPSRIAPTDRQVCGSNGEKTNSRARVLGL